MDITLASIAGLARDALGALGGASLAIATTLALGLPAAVVFAAA